MFLIGPYAYKVGLQLCYLSLTVLGVFSYIFHHVINGAIVNNSKETERMSFNTADFHRLSMLIIVHWSFEALLSASGAGLDGVLDNGLSQMFSCPTGVLG